jgi:hypothetical protein
MRYARPWFTPALGSALLACAWGCGGGTPSVDTTTAEATITGTVRIRGKPMAGGEITFDASNYKRGEEPRKGPIGNDGTYSIKTLQGRNTVRILGPAVKKEPELGYGVHTVEVQAGENPPFDIELPPPNN